MRTLASLVLVAFGTSATVFAPAVGAQATDPVPGLLAQLSNSSLSVRMAAFYGLVDLVPAPTVTRGSVKQTIQVLVTLGYPQDEPQIAAALEAFLLAELSDTALSTLGSGPDDESAGDFVTDIIAAVAGLGDPTTIPVLAKVIATGGLATDTLAGFGPQALNVVLPLIYSTDDQVSDAAAYTLMTMLTPQYASLVADAASQSKIRAGLAVAVARAAPPSPNAFLQATYRSSLTGIGAVPGDLNGDGLVNCADLTIIKASFGKKVGQVGFDIRADVNGDGVVNILDLSTESRQLPAGTVCN